ncbi:histidinol-phosphate transaminase [Anaerocolumna sp. AGMB13020]|uniref:histidinol-phosphate transaminase n=1 Tax=Anaerocolumna sp. AGMB13020 TaxID=3081750 RepID=UPI0029530376|nr:histidinol-phosphate transaminase [Anaerocolumna sp. AGMB13020]WOO36348.1 histidinol-phosphate transaminase [Anaerocolumna sp. AGMB13020]
MSKFFDSRYEEMEAYVPGEQPADRRYIKLNANETSMPPSPKVLEAVNSKEILGMGLYSDPYCTRLREAIAGVYGLEADQVFVGNGSDEVLSFCFLSFFGEASKICFPDITYYFYHTYSKTYGLDALEIPLKEDFTIDVKNYIETDRHVIIANPNAPTGYRLSRNELREIISAKKERLVIVDEAYVDYGNESCIELIKDYSNLIVIQTFSKSRNLAGLRLGFAAASKEIIEDMNKIKFTFNPYNLSALTIAAGTAAILDTGYYKECIEETIRIREETAENLRAKGFYVMKSHTNFLFVKHDKIHASEYYLRLKEEGILTRYFKSERIKDFLRITVGTKTEMAEVLRATEKIIAGC